MSIPQRGWAVASSSLPHCLEVPAGDCSLVLPVFLPFLRMLLVQPQTTPLLRPEGPRVHTSFWGVGLGLRGNSIQVEGMWDSSQ